MPLKLSNGEMLDEFRENNLRKLAYWHLGPGVCSPMGFDMQQFCHVTGEPGPRGFPKLLSPQQTHKCGSVGCLVGHGPFAGIEARTKESWNLYVCRCFLPNCEYCFSWEAQWCFGSEWFRVDNTPEGGAMRILWLLEFGLPSDWEQQMDGDEPLCYANWAPEIPEPIREEWRAREALLEK